MLLSDQHGVSLSYLYVFFGIAAISGGYTSAMHLGVALGAALGGVVIAKGSLEMTPLVGALMTTLALAAAGLSLMAGARRKL